MSSHSEAFKLDVGYTQTLAESDIEPLLHSKAINATFVNDENYYFDYNRWSNSR